MYGVYLPSGHTVKEVLLWSNSSQKPSINKTSRPGAGIIRQKGRKKPAAEHQRRTLTLQLYLAKQARYLHTVYLWRDVWVIAKEHIITNRFSRCPRTLMEQKIVRKCNNVIAHSWSFSSRLDHELQTIARKGLVQPSWNTGSVVQTYMEMVACHTCCVFLRIYEVVVVVSLLLDIEI